MNFKESLPVVYTAQSKHWFHAKMLVCKYALEQGVVPLNPFNLWAYFLDDLVERDLVRRANHNIVRTADQIWVFGPIADGVLAEINYAIELKKPIRYFSIGSKVEDIQPIEIAQLVFEPELDVEQTVDRIRTRLKEYEQNYVTPVVGSESPLSPPVNSL
jgi:hypothetical protein